MKNIKAWINGNLFGNTRINTRRVEKNGKWILTHFPDKHSKIIELTGFLGIDVSFSERIYCILNDIDSNPVCKNCNVNKVQFQKFSKGYLDYCSIKCGTSSKQTIDKKKITKLKNHGDENYNNREKAKETWLEKYGVEHHWMSKAIRDKRKKTWLEKYGVGNPSQCNIIEAKKVGTVRKNYGVDKPAQSEVVRERYINTCLEKYGVDNTFKHEIFKELANQTKLEKYGDINYNNKEITIQKARENFKKNIIPIVLKNIEENTKYEIVHNNAVKCHDKITIKCENGHLFEKKVCSLLNNHFCPTCNVGTSSYEREIFSMLEDIDTTIYTNSKSFISPYELDIYLPENKLAIEFNGIYWHSESNGKDKKYHLNKTNMCNNIDIQLLHIFENEWLHKKDIVKSVILSKLGIFKHKYFARKCIIKEIDTKVKNDFLEENHLQGIDRSSIKLGLFYGDRLLSVMTFGRRKITGGKSNFELVRYCCKKHTQIIGGASKIFKYFINNYHYNEIITYADRRYSNGNFYEILGFKLSHISNPNYWYFKLPDTTLINRLQFQKHKLPDKLDNFDHELTEHDNMILNGYEKIWDCGNYVYKFENKKASST